MIEDTILSHLVFDETYTRKVVAFLKPEYFSDTVHKSVYAAVDAYIQKYNSCPSIESLKIELSSTEGLNEQTYYEVSEFVSKLEVDPTTNHDWLLENTEKFCQDKAIYNAIMESISIIDSSKDSSVNLSRGSIPKIMSDALAVSFDTSVGHDYLMDASERFDFYRLKEDKIAFDLHYFNEITKGGVSRKTLNVILASTGVGKSMVMCHMAASNLIRGHNVLYITLEMAEERISERIDVNLLNLTFEELGMVTKEQFTKRVEQVKGKTTGKLIVKEYATASAGVATFRSLLNELKIKKNFVPDIIYIDYLNIAVSSRIKMGNAVNSYTYIKAIAEEFRGLAIEFNVPIISATQTNRGGAGNSDVELTDTSESYGLPMTVDFMFALISDEDLEKQGQIIVKQLKNRYEDMNKLKRFIVGVDKSRMKLFDVEASAQSNLMQGPEDDSYNKSLKKSKDDKYGGDDRFKDLF